MSLLRISRQAARLKTPQCTRSVSSYSSSTQLLDVLEKAEMTRSPPSTQRNANRAAARNDGAVGFMERAIGRPKSGAAEVEENERREGYLQQQYRRWKTGDVYAPHDLSAVEQGKWKKGRQAPKFDAFDAVGVNPIMEYKNYTMMSEYMTEMGRIKHSKQTGLRPVNQRKIAKAIRRAVGLGLMPSVHRHPLVLNGKGNRFS